MARVESETLILIGSGWQGNEGFDPDGLPYFHSVEEQAREIAGAQSRHCAGVVCGGVFLILVFFWSLFVFWSCHKPQDS